MVKKLDEEKLLNILKMILGAFIFIIVISATATGMWLHRDYQIETIKKDVLINKEEINRSYVKIQSDMEEMKQALTDMQKLTLKNLAEKCKILSVMTKDVKYNMKWLNDTVRTPSRWKYIPRGERNA